MKNKIVLSILFLLFIAYSGFAQINPSNRTITRPPDYALIGNEIIKKNSPFFLPALLERYQKNDTTLSEDDYWYMYFGYTYHKDYKPFGLSSYVDSAQAYIKKENPSNAELNLIIKYAKNILEDYPFSIRALNYLGYAYSKMGDKINAAKIAYKTNKVIITILKSGDGLKQESSWHIISIDNEYDIMQTLNVKFGGKQELLNDYFDHLTLAPNKYQVTDIYFNVGRMLLVSELNKNKEKKAE